MLPYQPFNSKWTEVFHPSHVGPALDTHHGPGHSEQRHHEHLAGLPGINIPISAVLSIVEPPVQGLHHQEAGQGRHGDRALHPEPAGGESRGRHVHLHKAN